MTVYRSKERLFEPSELQELLGPAFCAELRAEAYSQKQAPPPKMTLSTRPRSPRIPFYSHVTNWTDVDNIPDPDLRAIEDQVEMRMKAKRLCDCELPEGFALVTPEPRQYWIEQQLRWCFELSYGSRRFVARYIQQATDEMQMVWALQDFTAELIQKGVFRAEQKRTHPTARERAEMVLQ